MTPAANSLMALLSSSGALTGAHALAELRELEVVCGRSKGEAPPRNPWVFLTRTGCSGNSSQAGNKADGSPSEALQERKEITA
jgi:hypothetical protein